MSSKKTPDVDFERDLPTTAEDIEALDRARQHRALPTDVYLKWLTQMSEGRHHTPRLNTDSDEPFEL